MRRLISHELWINKFIAQRLSAATKLSNRESKVRLWLLTSSVDSLMPSPYGAIPYVAMTTMKIMICTIEIQYVKKGRDSRSS